VELGLGVQEAKEVEIVPVDVASEDVCQRLGDVLMS
jgi:hypothetical protein